jgi:hypothetical protein
LHAEGQHITEPILPDKKDEVQKEEPAARDNIIPAFNIEVERSEEEDDYEEEEEESTPKKQKATPKKATSTPKMAKKSAPKKDLSIDDLAKSFDGTNLEGLPQMASAGLGFPILCGRYTKEKRITPFKVETNSFVLIRMIPHNCLTEKMVTLEWTDNQTLVVTIQWPSFFWKIGDHISFQKGSTAPVEFLFPEDHIVFNSVARYLQQRADLTDENRPKVYDKIVFRFDNPMDTAFGYSEVLGVEITEADLDKAAGEQLPTGNTIKVHQIILKEAEPEEERKKTIITSARKTKTGKSIYLSFMCVY